MKQYKGIETVGIPHMYIIAKNYYLELYNLHENLYLVLKFRPVI